MTMQISSSSNNIIRPVIAIVYSDIQTYYHFDYFQSHFLKKYNHNNNKIGYLKTKKGDFSGNEGNSEIQDNIDEINTTTMTTNQNKKINEIAHPQDLQKKALNSNEKTGRKKSSYLEKFRQRSGKL